MQNNQTKFIRIFFYSFDRTIETSPPSTSPGNSKDPFLKVDALLQKGSGVPSISSCDRNSLPELKKYSGRIEQMHNDFMAVYCEDFDQLPKPELERLFGSNADKLLKFKVMKQSLNAKTKLTGNLIKSNDSHLDSFPLETAIIPQQEPTVDRKNDGQDISMKTVLTRLLDIKLSKQVWLHEIFRREMPIQPCSK